MSHPSIDVILFDLGGVLIELTGVPTMLEWTRGNGSMSVEELWRRWLTSPAVRRFESGGSTPEAFARAMIAEFGLPVGVDAFLAAFTAWPRGPYPGAADLLRTLSATYRLGLLSNSNALHWERIRSEMGLLPWFEFVFVSFQTGLLKPDAEVFQHAVRVIGLPADRILFLDDNRLNVEGARAVGMEAYQVEGVEGVKSRLRGLEVI